MVTHTQTETQTQMRSRVLPIYDSAASQVPLLSTAADVWRYRFLVANLVSRDLKVRYKRSVLGFIWVMLNPLLTMAVLAVVFAEILRVQQPYYISFLLIGILLMNLFSQGSTAAMSSIMANGPMLRKLYVPPAVFTVATVGSAVVNFVFALGPALILMVVDGVRPHATWVFAIVPLVETSVLALGVGLALAAMMVFFHDTFEIYQVFINAYMYATPVMYPLSLLDKEPLLRSIERFNPMAQTLDATRVALINGQLPLLSDSVIAAVLCVGVLLLGLIVFVRAADRFVYYV